MDLEELITKEFAGSGAAIGFFYISYELVRLQIMEMLTSEKNAAKKKLLIQNKRLNTIYHQKVREIQKKLEAKPKNVQELVEKQKLMQNLEETLQSQRKELLEIRQLCGEFWCKIDADQLKVSIDSDNIVNSIYRNVGALQK